MNKRSFDDNIVIAILAGGVGIMLYDIFQLSFQFWYHIISFDQWNKEFFPKAFGGIAVLLFALFYALISKLLRKRRNNTSSQDSTMNKNKNSFSGSDQESNDVKLHPRARMFAHVIITIIFLTLVSIAMWYLSGYHDTVYNYTPIDHANDTFGFVKIISTGELIPIRLDSYVHLETTSLSAQNKIDVSAKAYESITFDHRLDNLWGTPALPDTLCLVFPNALPFEEQPNGAGGFYGLTIPMKEDKDNHWYYGEASIKYPFEGQNGYTFLDVNNTGLNNPTCDKTTAQLSNLYNTTKIKKSIQDDDKYFVGSTSLTDGLRTSDTTIALTLILIAFGFLGFRDIIRSGFIRLADFHK